MENCEFHRLMLFMLESNCAEPIAFDFYLAPDVKTFAMKANEAKAEKHGRNQFI